MKRSLIPILLALSLFQGVMYSQTAGQIQPQKRIALVIGNASYINSTLANPESDARAMKAALQAVGFTVYEYENLSQSQMKKAIDDFGLKLKGNAVGLFYYAGHGIQSKGYNYLIPVDAQLQSEQQVEYDCVQADRVLALMEGSGSKVNIVILDACRNNPFERSWTRSATGSGLAFMNAPRGSLIAYATSPGSTASDGRGSNGLYTSAILESIKIPNITILEMFQNVRNIVSQKSNDQQTPWESTSLTGNFYFNYGTMTDSAMNELNPRISNNSKEVVDTPGIISNEQNKIIHTTLINPDKIEPLDDNFKIMKDDWYVGFGGFFNPLKMGYAGNVIQNVDSNRIDIHAIIAFEFFFSGPALQVMSGDLRKALNLSPVNLNTDFYINSMKALLSGQSNNQIKEQIDITSYSNDLTKKPNFQLLLNDVKLFWNEPTSSFRSTGKIGVGFIGSQSINVYLDGAIEIQKRRSGDLLDIYLKADEKTWYYFSYFRGVLMTVSGNNDYNAIITSTKLKDRKDPDATYKNPFTYMIALPDKLENFLLRMKRMNYD